MGPPSSTAILAALVSVAVIILAVAWRQGRRAGQGFHAGPYGIGLYDHPYRYPVYGAQEAVAWDRDGRCAAYCSLPGDCTIWCR